MFIFWILGLCMNSLGGLTQSTVQAMLTDSGMGIISPSVHLVAAWAVQKAMLQGPTCMVLFCCFLGHSHQVGKNHTKNYMLVFFFSKFCISNNLFSFKISPEKEVIYTLLSWIYCSLFHLLREFHFSTLATYIIGSQTDSCHKYLVLLNSSFKPPIKIYVFQRVKIVW